MGWSRSATYSQGEAEMESLSAFSIILRIWLILAPLIMLYLVFGTNRYLYSEWADGNILQRAFLIFLGLSCFVGLEAPIYMGYKLFLRFIPGAWGFVRTSESGESDWISIRSILAMVFSFAIAGSITVYLIHRQDRVWLRRHREKIEREAAREEEAAKRAIANQPGKNTRLPR